MSVNEVCRILGNGEWWEYLLREIDETRAMNELQDALDWVFALIEKQYGKTVIELAYE